MSTPQIVLASSNPGKLEELQRLLAGLGVEVMPQSAFSVEDVEETGLTFVENAILKARHAAAASGRPAIADDSGLVVEALEGAPGVCSARYAGADASDEGNVEKLLRALADVPDAERGAHFQCVTVYLEHARDPTPLISEGRWEGRIAREPRGTGGFGYDPVFYVPELGCTAAELPPERKNAMSHRGKALRRLCARLELFGPA